MQVRATQVAGRFRGPAGRRTPRAARRSSRAALPGVLLLALALTAGGCDIGEVPTAAPTSKSTAKPVALTLGVYGAPDELAALQAVVENFDSRSVGATAELRSWPSHDGLMNAIRAGGKVPDVFMVSRRDLGWLQDQHLTQPVDELLDERGVDFGDDYSRDALQAFSSDNRVQCMPYGVAPTVIFYNRSLVDFDKMLARGLDAPDLSGGGDPRWTFDQFAAAAGFATRPKRGTRGLYIEPTLRSLAPFIYSGGGSLFDDDERPTSLALSEDGSRSALERTLELLRDPHVNLTDRQLAKASDLQWFEDGKLGMIEGTRALVPQLRLVQGLDFDVMPMPVLDHASTVGDITGLCLSSHAASTAMGADLLVHTLSTESVARVVRAGYLSPANLKVALTDDFLQPGRLPEHAGVFNSSLRTLEIAPLLSSWSKLEGAVAASLRELVRVPLFDLDAITAQIDEESRTVLTPEPSGSASPSSE